MAGEPVISVRGEAVIEVEPEIARVEVTVMARDRDRRRAIDLLAGRSRRVAAAIKVFGDAMERLESHPVTAYPEFKEGKGKERIAGYVAEGGFTVTVADFAVLGELVSSVATEELVSVAGPAWLLRTGSPVWRQARLAAARDATQRAREYAEAFGARITGLVEAADSGLLTESHEREAPFAVRTAARFSAAAAEGLAEFDFSPARQTVTAQVEARFTMTQPSLND